MPTAEEERAALEAEAAAKRTASEEAVAAAEAVARLESVSDTLTGTVASWSPPDAQLVLVTSNGALSEYPPTWEPETEYENTDIRPTVHNGRPAAARHRGDHRRARGHGPARQHRRPR